MNKLFVVVVSNGGSFFIACEDLGMMLEALIPLLRFFFFFFEVEVSSRALITLFMPGSVQSGSAI